MKLEDLQPGLHVRGVLPSAPVTIIAVEPHGTDSLTLYYKRIDGQPGVQLLYRENEAALEKDETALTWSVDAHGNVLRRAGEAHRIRLAHLFDPLLAVHTSLIDPLPHQITAVYGDMLSRQPLRFLLADDPGSGKTIMAGLLIKELIVRGDVRRCLICAPGSLSGQWQTELAKKFGLHFEIITAASVEQSPSGNPFTEHDLIIIRLDQVSRNDDLQARLRRAEDWDLVVCDEAHKMSASYFGGEVRVTRRYELGRLLRENTRHMLLMTATPHNGREEDFYLFMRLLDPERFEGRVRDDEHGTVTTDVTDLMRRMVKERLLKFDGRPLFPERRAYTVSYLLSDDETRLYREVTEYVRQEFNRADALDGQRRGTIGFALTVLQRRLASSPRAIYESLRRRRERLEDRLRTLTTQPVTVTSGVDFADGDPSAVDDALEDIPETELEAIETEVADNATAAQSAAELNAEIAILRRLESSALNILHSGHDRKWEQLANLIHGAQEMYAEDRRRHKLVIFTEHRDTLTYLEGKLRTLLGSQDAVVSIHGGAGMTRERREAIQEEFGNNPNVIILVATDAAGEGINLQCAHLMINYDLPWNPNRIEQRFGRIHRIRQTEVCHLWNLLADGTREGEVYLRLLWKLEEERQALGGQVFDVLGQLFTERPLRELLIEAIRYGDQPEVRARLEQAIDNSLDRQHVRELLDRNALVANTMDISEIMSIREDMERASARRLQPFFIKSFFLDAFASLGGTIHEREPGRYSITHVPYDIRQRRKRVAREYDRICFDKRDIDAKGKPTATFVHPGHPLLDSVIELILERDAGALDKGHVLIDMTDPGKQPRALYFIEGSIRDAERVISREMYFLEVGEDNVIREAGSAPYLDYRAATEDEVAMIKAVLKTDGIPTASMIGDYAAANLVPAHLQRVRERREALIDKTVQAVQARLTREINYWDKQAGRFAQGERDGKPAARLNREKAQRRADDLQERLNRRQAELVAERAISAMPPVVVGRALIVPAGMILEHTPTERHSQITEQAAMQAVTQVELALGNEPRDVSLHKLGYDVESRHPPTSSEEGTLRFIEVKGYRPDAEHITLTKNEILTALNTRDAYILALVEVPDAREKPKIRYLRQPVTREPDFGATGVNYNLGDLLSRSQVPQ